MKFLHCLAILAALSAAADAASPPTSAPVLQPSAEQNPPGFDPQRHMRVAEVRPGMKGYGLSVFAGTKIERFEVEVISILRNFSPRQDVVLIRASGCNLEHTGSIAGMSGSPIFLRDDQGRDRLLGAFAYGWPMMKDPLAGVQPIEYMLSIPLYENRQAEASENQGYSQTAQAGNWSVLNAVTTARQQFARPTQAPFPLSSREARLTPLVTPLSIGGLNSSAVSALGTLLEPLGFAALQSGGTGDAAAAGKIEPGSVMAVPLLTGDIDMTALGTCTEVVGGKVYGFGHPFTGEGPVAMPMCGGQVNGVIANLVTSFKLGSASKPLGTLLADHVPGIAGQLGAVPPTAPIKIQVKYADGTLDRQYRFNAVIHPQFTPLLSSAAIFGSLSGAHELPRLNTVDYDLRIEFSDGHKVRLADMLTNVDPGRLFMGVAAPIAAAADNPFQRVMVKSVEGEFQIQEGAREAEILHVGASRLEYRPGETVRFFATLQPFRSVEVIQPLEFTLPADLPDGTYQLTVSDLSRFVLEEHTASPFRFTAGNIGEVFASLNELAGMRSNAFYLRLVRPNASVAVGRTSLPRLPGSQRQLLLSTGRSDVTSYTPTDTKTVPAKWVVSGNSELKIQVSKEMRPLSPAAIGNAPPSPGPVPPPIH